MKHKDIRTLKSGGKVGAFTFVELLVVVATLALLALTLLPALARNRVKPQGTQCLYNLRQITLAWMMYANESSGKLTPNHGIYPANPDYATTSPAWVAGSMDYTGSHQTISGIADATNSALLVNPTYSELGPYVRNPQLFRCPADLSQFSGAPRVRSYSMNCAVGSTANGTLVDSTHVAGHWLSSGNATSPGGTPFRVYLKDSDFTPSLSPASLYLLLDEHPDSINDGVFQFQMPTGWPAYNPLSTAYIDIPAKYHKNAGNFSFADGHAETHPWSLPSAIPAITYTGGLGGQAYTVPDNPDVAWLASHATTLAPP